MRAPRARILAAGAVTVSLAAGAVAWAAPSKTGTTTDATTDVAQGPDIQRVSLGRASDGRLRAVVTFTSPVRPADLMASSGPPGSVCLRLWTTADPDPAAQRPDHLICVTARSEDELRGSVLRQAGTGLPKRSGSASVQQNGSERSVIVRFSQTAIGRPARIRYAVEATRSGCVQPSCIDTAPNAPGTRAFRLR